MRIVSPLAAWLIAAWIVLVTVWVTPVGLVHAIWRWQSGALQGAASSRLSGVEHAPGEHALVVGSQTPVQQSVPWLQGTPVAKHPQVPVELQTWSQQSLEVVHAAPAAAQPQVPLELHVPVQQSASPLHEAPSPEQPQWPLVLQ